MNIYEQIKFVGKYSGYNTRKRFYLFVYLASSASVQVFTSFWVAKIVDALTDSSTIQWQTITFFIFLVGISSICQLSRRLIINRISVSSEKCIFSNILYNKFLKCNLLNENMTASNLNSLLLVRIQEYRIFLKENFENLFYRPLVFGLSVIVMLALDAKMSSLVLVSVGVSTLINIFLNKNMINVSNIFYETQSDFFRYQKELIDQYDITVMSGIKKKALILYEEKAQNLQSVEKKMLKFNQRAYIPALLNEYLPTIIYLLLLMENSNEISYGTALALLSIVSGISLPLAHSLRALADFKKWIPFMMEIKRTEKEEDIVIVSKKEMEYNCLMEFDNVHFSYDGKVQNLKIDNLKIFRGDKIAIVGQSGSGKTTFLKLIMGMLNAQNGTIFGMNDVDECNLKDFWAKVSYIDNNTYILPGTLCYNITFCNNIDDLESKERYYDILDQFDLREFENKDIVQFGKNLSGGQKMKICLARALYKNSDLIILDEPMASLDVEFEQVLIDCLEKILKTVIIVTHRKAVLKICNRIFYVKDGVVNEKKSN